MSNEALSICPNVEYWYTEWGCAECDCAKDIVDKFLHNISRSDECPTSCSTTEYSGKITHDGNSYHDKSAALHFKFAYPLVIKVYEEYIIYDIIAMIGSVGGTLGLFIGFSFNNILANLIKYFQWIAMKIVFKNFNSKIDHDELQIGKSERYTRD